jgi:DNA processing protein
LSVPYSFRMTESDSKQSWLRLLICETVSYRQRLNLLRIKGLTEAAHSITLSATDERRLESNLAWLATRDHHLICLDDPRYPTALLEIDSPPLGLFVIGDHQQLRLPSVAIVGSRHSTVLGETTAKDFAAELSARNICVLSGMARGIDAAAHEGALANPASSSRASTIAVLGTGVNLCYPASNRALYAQIAQRGCLISEFPLDYPPLKENFPRRNRIVAGMARGVLIVEAARQSGSLITARQALGYGREVFAVPGSIHSATSKGCHQLLREGATLCESIDDILLALRWNQPASAGLAGSSAALSNQAPARDPAWQWFGNGPVSLEQLCDRSGESIQIWLQQLGIWEMNGLIERTLDGRFQRAVI